MHPIAWIVVGGALGAACLAPAIRFSRRGVLLVVLIAVVAMNGIYVGAALNSPIGVLLGETALATVLCVAAFVLYRSRSVWLVACVFVHGVVDGLHQVIEAAPIPEWYILACLGFDLAYGAVAAWLVSRAPYARS